MLKILAQAASDNLPPLPSGDLHLPLPGGAGQDTLPHGIRGLATYPFSLTPVMAALIAALLLTGLLGWWLYRRKGPKKEVLAPKADPLGDLQKAITDLKPSGTFTGKESEDYFFRLGLLFREVLEHCCGFPATDLTLRELKQPVMELIPFNHMEKQEIMEFFKRSDMIKFAGSATDLPEATRYYTLVMNQTGALIARFRQSHTEPYSKHPTQ